MQLLQRIHTDAAPKQMVYQLHHSPVVELVFSECLQGRLRNVFAAFLGAIAAGLKTPESSVTREPLALGTVAHVIQQEALSPRAGQKLVELTIITEMPPRHNCYLYSNDQ